MSGIDDHSRFVVSARVVARATARPVCDALAFAMAAHGVPEQILTDNGKVFTARFGPGPGPVLFDRICADNGITPPVDGAAVADHDRQGRALAQDAAPRVPRREGVRLDRRRPSPAGHVGAALQP